MADVLVADGLTKRYGRRTALADCTLSVPAGLVVGLVGPNGAGKSTLLQLACGLLTPSAGRIEVLGVRPASGSPRVGFVAQDTPVYESLTVAEHLRMGRHVNPSWDAGFAGQRIASVGLDPAQKAGRLSGGQRAQLALTVAAAKRPDLLVLDEPVSSLDPLARREFLQGLMELTAEREISVIMSSHLIWLSWRQFRTQVLAVAAIVLVVVASTVLTWGQVSELARNAGCRVTDCDTRAADVFSAAVFSTVPGILYWLFFVLMLVVPVLLGIFWGAPLVARELETGTYRMIFSQSVGRRRWLLVKLAVGGAAVALCEGLASLVLTPWARLIDLAGGSRISPLIFASRGIVPIAYGALAFVIGVLAGQMLRRTLTAMAVTMLAVIVLQVAAPFLLLSYLAQPEVLLTPLAIVPEQPLIVNSGTGEAHLVPVGSIQGAWVIDRLVVTPAGTEFTGPVDPATCNPQIPNPLTATCMAWLGEQHLSRKITLVPGSQFWALQWREFGVLTVLTLGVSAVAVRRITR